MELPVENGGRNNEINFVINLPFKAKKQWEWEWLMISSQIFHCLSLQKSGRVLEMMIKWASFGGDQNSIEAGTTLPNFNPTRNRNPRFWKHSVSQTIWDISIQKLLPYAAPFCPIKDYNQTDMRLLVIYTFTDKDNDFRTELLISTIQVFVKIIIKMFL